MSHTASVPSSSAKNLDPSLWVDDRPEAGIFRIHSDVYAAPEIFELEQRYIFDRTWSFLGHESQLPSAGSFISTRIGRREILVTRDKEGQIRAFINSCRHKGAMLVRTESGNSRLLVCPYHGWVYDFAGRNVHIKDREEGNYSEAFGSESHDLIAIAHVAVYRGFIFGALSREVPPLREFLGELAPFIDLASDQSEQGMEFVPGRIVFRYRGNWKLQMENGTDFYHLTSTHAGFMDIMSRRGRGEGNTSARQFDWQKRLSQNGGTFQFGHGHAVVWMDQAEVEKRPIFPMLGELKSRIGDVRAAWMLKVRGMSVFPNMQIADGASLTLRVAYPLAVDSTEVRYYCLAPVGERADLRAWRLRQFEDFFNVSGMATPDDVVIYEDCQRGFSSSGTWLQGAARGMVAVRPGGNATSEELECKPDANVFGSFTMQNETTLHPMYREWARLLDAGLNGKPAYV